MNWSPEDIAWHDRIVRQKREREAEIREILGWSSVTIGLYSIDTYLPPPRHALSGRINTSSKRSSKLAQKRQTHQREVSNA